MGKTNVERTLAYHGDEIATNRRDIEELKNRVNEIDLFLRSLERKLERLKKKNKKENENETKE